MEQEIKTVCITFDVDLVNYLSNASSLEMERSFQSICSVLSEFPQIKTTWFFRIDQQIEALFGDAEHIFLAYQDELNWLSENGHEIGWHHHAYKMSAGRWIPENSTDAVLAHLKNYAPLARRRGLKIARMGWGTQSVQITNFLEESGFIVDSSAIPRPTYPWDKGLKDWENAPVEPFFPAYGTYKVKGPIRELLQVPISTVILPFEDDTIPDVCRYINPAYHSVIFKQAIQSYRCNVLTTITHPYEIMASDITKKSPLAFSLEVFKENLRHLTLLPDVSFVTITNIRKNMFTKTNQSW